MYLCGLQKLAMVDYPGKLAATVFTGGCNLRCPFCHNALLVTRLDETPELGEEAVLSFLATRTKLLDGVVLSGGEPLLQPDAADFLRKIRQMGFAVKLDTNGGRPAQLRALAEAGLVDYVAMDVKNSPGRYGETTGVPGLDLAPFRESVSFLLQGTVDYEFRTTAVKGLHTRADFEGIAQWIAGAKEYYIQEFKDSGDLIAGQGLDGFTEAEMHALAEVVRPLVPSVQVRGI